MVARRRAARRAGARARRSTQVLELRTDDAMATEALDELDVAAENWRKFADEVRPGGERVDRSQPRDRALRVGGRGVRAVRARRRPRPSATCARRSRSIRRTARRRSTSRGCCGAAERWQDLGELLDERAERAPTVEEKVAALIALAERRARPARRRARARCGDQARARARSGASAARCARVTDAAAAAQRLAGARRGVPGRAQGAARRRRPRHAAADRDGAVEARRRSRSGRGVLPARSARSIPRTPPRSTSIARTTRRRARTGS